MGRAYALPARLPAYRVLLPVVTEEAYVVGHGAAAHGPRRHLLPRPSPAGRPVARAAVHAPGAPLPRPPERRHRAAGRRGGPARRRPPLPPPAGRPHLVVRRAGGGREPDRARARRG